MTQVRAHTRHTLFCIVCHKFQFPDRAACAGGRAVDSGSLAAAGVLYCCGELGNTLMSTGQCTIMSNAMTARVVVRVLPGSEDIGIAFAYRGENISMSRKSQSCLGDTLKRMALSLAKVRARTCHTHTSLWIVHACGSCQTCCTCERQGCMASQRDF